MKQREHVKVYTRAWRDDMPVYDLTLEEPNSNVDARVFIDGREIVSAFSASVKHSGDFSVATLELHPASYTVVLCTDEEWGALARGEDIGK